jgi:hypothetical protein
LAFELNGPDDLELASGVDNDKGAITLTQHDDKVV